MHTKSDVGDQRQLRLPLRVEIIDRTVRVSPHDGEAPPLAERTFVTVEEAQAYAQEWVEWLVHRQARLREEARKRSEAARELFIARLCDRRDRARARFEQGAGAMVIVDGFEYWRRDIPPRKGARPESRTRGRAPRRRRSSARACARAPSDDPHERPRPLTAAERRALRLLIDRGRRLILAHTASWRTCAKCLREQEPDEFSSGAKYCRSCERERVAEYRRRKVAA